MPLKPLDKSIYSYTCSYWGGQSDNLPHPWNKTGKCCEAPLYNKDDDIRLFLLEQFTLSAIYSLALTHPIDKIIMVRIIFAQFSNLLHTAYSTCTWVRGVVLNRCRKKKKIIIIRMSIEEG